MRVQLMVGDDGRAIDRTRAAQRCEQTDTGNLVRAHGIERMENVAMWPSNLVSWPLIYWPRGVDGRERTRQAPCGSGNKRGESTGQNVAKHDRASPGALFEHSTVTNIAPSGTWHGDAIRCHYDPADPHKWDSTAVAARGRSATVAL